MKTKSKALLLTLCAVLLVTVSIFGTLAYFTDSEAVKNTFAVGSVSLELDETHVNPDGTIASTDRVKENAYELLPGRTYIKDPTVTVKQGSIESYVRMMVEVANIDDLKAALPDTKYYTDLDEDGVNDFVLELLLDGSWNYQEWHFAGYSEVGTSGIYEFRYYKTVADREDNSGQNFDNRLEPLFTKIKVPGEIDNDQLANLANVEINVTAHAIQAAGFNDADAAWNAFAQQHK